MIYHLVWDGDFRERQQHGEYRAATLETEGFAHATAELDKLLEVADAFFPPSEAGSSAALLLLGLDETQIPAPVRYEDPGVGHLFPHVYGPIPLAAITPLGTMQRVADLWALPPEVEPGN